MTFIAKICDFGLAKYDADLSQTTIADATGKGTLECMRKRKKEEFIEEVLPEVYKTMQLLEISIEEFNALYHQNQNSLS
jgi:hypothetical protein